MLILAPLVVLEIYKAPLGSYSPNSNLVYMFLKLDFTISTSEVASVSP